jgi:hypothetical protein
MAWILLVSVAALLLIWLLLALYTIDDLLKPERAVRGGNRYLWAAVIILGSFLGLALYWGYGREG